MNIVWPHIRHSAVYSRFSLCKNDVWTRKEYLHVLDGISYTEYSKANTTVENAK